MPLTHCRRSDNPTLCKADFPRSTWLTETPLVLCPGEMKNRNIPCSGKKNRVGMLFGPRNDENLNGTCPAFMSGLPGLGCNTDVQLPYRMVITP